MKFLFCKKCKDIIQLASKLKSCKCKNVIGKYAEDNITGLVHASDREDARIIGIANTWLENDHMHFEEGLPGGFNDDPNPKSMFNLRRQPIVIVPLFTTGDIKPLKNIPEGNFSDIDPEEFLTLSISNALNKVKELKDTCVGNNWKYPEEVQAFYANDHRIKVIEELLTELRDSKTQFGFKVPSPNHLNLWTVPIQSSESRMSPISDRIDDMLDASRREIGDIKFAREYLNEPLSETPGAKSVSELDEMHIKLERQPHATLTFDLIDNFNKNKFFRCYCTDAMNIPKIKEVLVLQKDCEKNPFSHCKGCHIRDCS